MIYVGCKAFLLENEHDSSKKQVPRPPPACPHRLQSGQPNMMAENWPAGACDCHVHVIGDAATYPMAPERHYTPGAASTTRLRAHLSRNNLARAVIVQPSIYGTDNRCVLDSLRELGRAGRGVAVVEKSISNAALAALSGQGVRGLRINVESASVRDPASVGPALAYWAARVAPLGWDLQVYAALDTVAAALPFLQAMAYRWCSITLRWRRQPSPTTMRGLAPCCHCRARGAPT
jgi:Amidohydrolase